MKRAGFVFGVLVLFAGAGFAEMRWDVLEEHYGSGSGEVSFNSKYTWLWGYGSAGETLSNGFARLSTSAGVNYAGRYDNDATFNMPSNGTWRLEIKLRSNDTLGMNLYLADNYSPRWGGLVMINHMYVETVAHPNTLGDYNIRLADGVDVAPSGFDGAAPHVYEFERVNSGSVTMRVDGAYVMTLLHGAGAPADGTEFQIGFGADKSTGPGTFDVYYVRISSLVPEPVTGLLVPLGGLLLMWMYSLRRRR